MHFTGIVIAACSFVVIWVFHPIVIKCEYYFSARSRPVFLAAGFLTPASSLPVGNTVLPCLLGAAGRGGLWSIGGLKEQAKRAEKGWFPKKTEPQAS